MLLALVSCTKNDDITVDPVNDTNIRTNDAPDNIVGKALVLYNSKMQYTLQVSEFASNSTCNVVMIGGVYKLVGTPSYTYSKSTANNATLEVKYSDHINFGSDYWNSIRIYTADLSFTSESGGTYTGFEKSTTTGNVNGINGTDQRGISGTFTLKSK